jgi:hypothetical protein
LAADRIGNAKYAGFRNRRMSFQKRIDFCRLYLEASAIDFVLDPAR